MKKVLLLWYTIGKNFGDVLIYKTIRNLLESNNIITDYIDVGLPCNEILSKANQYDYLIFAGGGIIERGVPNVIRYFKEDYHLLKVPYGVVGLGVGGFDYSEHKDSIRFWIENSSFFYTRDKFSYNKLVDTCGWSEKLRDGVDVVWSNENIYSNICGIGKELGYNLRDVPYLDIWPDMDWKQLKRILNINNYLYEISDESKQTSKVDLSREGIYSPDKCFSEIISCKTIIAMRYHVILVAAANGIPCIPIMYCPKVENLSKQLGIREYSVYVEEIDKLQNKIDKLKDNYEGLKLTLNKNVNTLKCKSKNILGEVLKKVQMEI